MSPLKQSWANLCYKAWLLYKGESAILSYAKQLKPLYVADAETLDKIKHELLTALLRHAYSTTSFYRDSFQRAGLSSERDLIAENYTSLPFLTKQDIVSHLDQLTSTAVKQDEIFYTTTGGSSGIPIKFCRDKRVTLIHRAQDHLFNSNIGVLPGARRAWVWGAQQDMASRTSLKAQLANYLTSRAIYFDSFDATPAHIREFINLLNQHRPDVIFAYPNMLASIATLIRDEKISVVTVPRVVVTAEPLYQWQRQLFQEVFLAATFERYGSREIGTVAAEDTSHDGMHICEPNYIFEVIGPDGKPITDGSPGELVITDLYNFAMPIIRYRTGDIVRIEATAPKHGWRRMTEVGGRVVDMILRPDGSEISGLAIMKCLHLSGINQQVKIIQTSPSELLLKHLSDFKVSDDARLKFQAKVDEIMKSKITIKYQVTDELEYDKSGKYRYITSQCSKSKNVTDR